MARRGLFRASLARAGFSSPETRQVPFISPLLWFAQRIGSCGFIENIDPACYIDPSAEEPVMRKIIFVIAIAAAVVGAGVVVASLSNPELAAAKCTSRC